MSGVNYQTIRLSRGNHRSPEEGACVMELSSMLGGERFTDHPRSVCPVIASFLRGYNDCLEDDRRQDLYSYASLVVGTRASSDVQQSRLGHMARWSNDMRERRWSNFMPRPIARLLCRVLKPPSGIDILASFALRSIGRVTDDTHVAALELVGQLADLGAPGPAPASPAPVRRPGAGLALPVSACAVGAPSGAGRASRSGA